MPSTATETLSIIELMGNQKPREQGKVLNSIRQAYSSAKPKKQSKPKK
jgi:hypothetical protein